MCYKSHRDNGRFEITYKVENGCLHYIVQDNFTGNILHCDESEVDNIINEMKGDN